MDHTSGRYSPFMNYTRYKKDTYSGRGAQGGLHGREPGERREKWGRKGTPEVAAEGPVTWYKKETLHLF